ncbi:ras-related protein Rab-30-like [Lytechinus pictus]|uniref:ras-related protein Rab-30-like n=1 Tax=Lytechinus variegatus TaxID=7654 RepID=UPI001BB23D52|nr:ras-related protein Rab-30-like [Lytechinus variegatus]XP_041457913.1 ras-related protein Rab-30-like [Lytechinus variegatus]XP_054754901.1 ras-related protein Rab-30-like [Lytechinus pictus]XP_054754902.1 ras-related protein Rab-30-like [Lytechinus pictus]
MEDYKYLFKVVLIGNAGVGKTCLVRRFTQGLFPPGQGATIGVDFMIKTIEIGGEKVKLQIWDTAGQERFRSITQSYYHSADALVLVFDVTSKESFNALPSWLREVEQYASPKVISVLVGNKIDLAKDREVNEEDGQSFADSHSMRFLETSAKESDNVDRLFLDIAVELTNNVRNGEIRHDDHEDIIKDTTSVSTCCKG